jgi:hypothetical protein
MFPVSITMDCYDYIDMGFALKILINFSGVLTDGLEYQFHGIFQLN